VALRAENRDQRERSSKQKVEFVFGLAHVVDPVQDHFLPCVLVRNFLIIPAVPVSLVFLGNSITVSFVFAALIFV
jgi:hypothetical protein